MSVYTPVIEGVAARTVAGQRLLVGIAGAPGAGKSTMAARLSELFADAVVVPMDGFHLANVELARLGYADRKGAPFTFDVAGYTALLRRLKSDRHDVIYAPSFDHVMSEPIAGSIPVPPAASLVITEGNYLLYWEGVRELLDLTVHIDAPADDRIAGLIERQRAKGLGEHAAREWVLRSDEANARLVQQCAGLADIRVQR